MSQAKENTGTEETLHLKLVGKNSSERELLNKLYAEAFPSTEWRPGSVAEIQKDLSDNWKTDEFLILDDDVVIGLICVMHSEKYAYLLYLAISPLCQGKGYGSRVLTLFKNMYPDRIRFFDLEVPDKSAANASQREARIRFYERNGYRLFDYVFEENGVQLTIMTDSDEFVITEEILKIGSA